MINTTTINTMNKNIKKTSQGRKKIEIKKIEEINNRQVTFSKRHKGIFKKAAELCVLTGSEVAVLVNTPGGSVYAFGHPTPDVIIDRYLNTNNNAQGISTPPLVIKEFNQYYIQKSTELDAEKRRKKAIQESKSVIGNGVPWYHEGFDINGMEADELEQYLSALVELKRKVLVRADELEMIRKDPKLLGLNLSDVGDLGFTHEIPNTMIPTNDIDLIDFGLGYSYNMDSMM